MRRSIAEPRPYATRRIQELTAVKTPNGQRVAKRTTCVLRSKTSTDHPLVFRRRLNPDHHKRFERSLP
jgi:hypothetical protein